MAKTKYITHTALDFDKYPKKKSFAEAIHRMIVQLKYDGCSAVVVHSPDSTIMYSRTGELITSFEHVCSSLITLPFDILAENIAAATQFDEEGNEVQVDIPEQRKYGVYIGELWHQDFAPSTISGFMNMTDPGKLERAAADRRKVQFVVYDFVTLDEWEAGESSIGYADRIGRILWMQGIYHPDEGGTFGEHKRPTTPPIWLSAYEGYLMEMQNATPLSLAEEACAAGRYDGIILRDEEGGWEQGARDERVLKVKPLLTVDVRVVGTEKGKGKYENTLGALICEYKGKRFTLSGMTDAQRDAWFNEPTLIVGKVVEVAAMSESVKGVLREPRFKRIREGADASQPE